MIQANQEKSAYQWGTFTWSEIDKLDRDATIFVLPTGAIEQHGPHLPIDTDIFNSNSLVDAVAKNWNTAHQGDNSRVITLPPIWWGTSPHHKGYPGTVSLRIETFHNLLSDIFSSIIQHGFYRFLIINGHGGNVGILNASMGELSESFGVSIPAYSYWQSIHNILIELGESEIGGMGHACEMETSLALYLRPELVNLNALRKDLPDSRLSLSCIDFRQPGFLNVPLDFRRDTQEGVMGDPTYATREKGQRIFDCSLLAANRLIKSLLEAEPSSFKTTRFSH